MLGEAVQVIRLLWSGERVSFEGKCYRLDNALCDPAPVQQPGLVAAVRGICCGRRRHTRTSRICAQI